MLLDRKQAEDDAFAFGKEVELRKFVRHECLSLLVNSHHLKPKTSSCGAELRIVG